MNLSYKTVHTLSWTTIDFFNSKWTKYSKNMDVMKYHSFYQCLFIKKKSTLYKIGLQKLMLFLSFFFLQRIPLRSGIVIPCTDSWSWRGCAGWRRRTPTTTTKPRHATLPKSLSCFRRQKSHVTFKIVAILKKDLTFVDCISWIHNKVSGS